MFDINETKEIYLDSDNLLLSFKNVGEVGDMVLLQIGENKTYKTIGRDGIISYKFPEEVTKEVTKECLLHIYNLTDNTKYDIRVFIDVPVVASLFSLEEPVETFIEPINYLIVNEQTRTITVPENEEIFGTEYEKDAEVKNFKVQRYVDNNIDLSQLDIQIVYQNAIGEIGKSPAKDVRATEDEVTFKWILPASAVGYKGNLGFLVRAVKTDLEGAETLVWSTTVAQGIVLKGLNLNGIIIEPADRDTIAQFMHAIKQTSTDAVNAVTAEGDKQIKRVQDVGNSYIKKEDLLEFVIKPRVQGNPLVLKDSVKYKPFKLELSGSITQGENPSLENPKEIVNGEWDSMSCTGKNLFDIRFEKTNFSSTIYRYDIYNLKPNTKYTLSSDIPKARTMASIYFNGTDSFVHGVNISVPRTDISDEYGHLYILLRHDTPNPDDINDYDVYNKILEDKNYIQLELGDKATTYEPYKGFTETLPEKIKLSKWDKIKLVDGVWKKEIGTKKIDNNILINEHFLAINVPVAHGSATQYYFSNNDVVHINDESVRVNAYSEHFKAIDIKQRGIESNTIYTATNAICFLSKEIINNVSSFIDLLKQKNVSLIYRTKTPTYEILPQSAQDLLNRITTYYPNTVLSTNKGIELNLQYIADPKLYNDRTNKEILDRISQLEATVIK